jgi:hypothetical protein
VPRLTANQVAGIAKTETPGGTTVAQWVAKARQESGFDTDADSGSSVGLWQVNVNAHHGNFTLPDNVDEARAQMKSPVRNWYVTKLIFGAQGWRAWAASGGEPRPTSADIAAADAPDLSIAGQGGADEPGVQEGIGPVNPLNALSNPLEAIRDLVKWVSDPNTWKRLALASAGIAAVIVGASIIAKPITEPAAKGLAGAAMKGKSLAR